LSFSDTSASPLASLITGMYSQVACIDADHPLLLAVIGSELHPFCFGRSQYLIDNHRVRLNISYWRQ
jgi:hypothetical protein